MKEIPIKAKGVAAFVVRQTGDLCQVLMLRRTGSNPGQWCQVSGKIEDGETAWQAALREIREETTLRVDRLYSADICEQFYVANGDYIWIAPVFVAIVRADQLVRLNREHSEFTWTTFEEAIGMVPFPGQKEILLYVRRHFVETEPDALLLMPGSGCS